MAKITKQITRVEAENILEKKFKGKNCSFTYPGYKTIYGMVDSIAIEIERKVSTVIIVINDKKYTVSIECLHDCLKLLK